MKYFLLLVVANGIAATLLILSCHEQVASESISISVIVDRTDALVLQPEHEKILSLMNLDPKSLTNIETGVEFRSSEISSVDVMQTKDFVLPPVSYHSVNAKARQKEIKAFFKQIQEALSTKQPHSSSEYSSIFYPLTREAKRLSQEKTNRKYLIVYSDMVEHAPWLDLYREGNTSEEVILQRFRKEMKLEKLEGLHIILRYIPVRKIATPIASLSQLR